MRELGKQRFDYSDGVQSLVWDGDDLVDWIGGGRRFCADGTITEPGVTYASFPVDRAVTSPNGKFVALYAERGTSGVILRTDGSRVRQINRDLYQAAAFDYPLALGRLADGRNVLVHCPDSYTNIEIEDLETGTRLSRSTTHGDTFHSRLQITRDGRHILSAGWFWHPVGIAYVYETEALVRDGEAGREKNTISPDVNGEVEAASFDGDDHVLVATSPDSELLDYDDMKGLGQSELGRWSLAERRWVTRAPLAGPAGLLMPLGDFALGFYDHPKLLEVATGRVVKEWREIASGKQLTSYSVEPPVGEDRTPGIAFDPIGKRFAVADARGITVIQLTEK